ncbi:MarR family winged helix-turn-helix transcriptional regulator [Umezawaea sp. Da 62-37]|uniref:MarR family winged helix-turn-helix transcriptional regulator n=1 Tax=Umezawaea sp. Da 62-37 TaxID=3075927 RepID=UPI0028F6FFB2|nr:MarR family winged helix-turn-helix transcriptional regulator [Umezawaea sp. Da 62-37]WNV91276.1 MarR family winged helix-turn-helix transcriptional regulator [Umezawaea sp. Da 62-37]
MGPTRETCVDVLRQLHAAFQLKHVMTARVWADEPHLHPAAVGLLAELARRGESRVSDLAQAHLVDTSVVSRQIAQLDRAGLVERRVAQHDGRVQLISVTPLGLARLDTWRQAQIDLVRQALAGWTEEDVQAFARQFGLFTDDLRSRLLVPEAIR